jgi:hypothetical protein
MNTYVQRFSTIVIFLTFLTASTYAQMDLLPFIFRDIPPELEQGIPAEMTYDEFLQLNRNVDFFTVGMSMIVPGYGYFSVDRPAAGYAILGGRVAGYGLMAAGVIRQWGDFRDVWNSKSLSAGDWEQLKINAFLFGTGAFVNIMLWGVDVLGAYHVSVREKNWVIYHYGLQSGARAPGEAEIFASYAAQDDPRVQAWLRHRLWELRYDPSNGDLDVDDYAGALALLASLEYEDGEGERAIVIVLEALTEGSAGHSRELISLGVDILSSTAQLSWGDDRRLVWQAMNAAAGGEMNRGELALLLPRLEDPGLRAEFTDLAIRHAQAPATGDPATSDAADRAASEDRDAVLMALAEAWEQDGEIRLAANAASKVLAFYPDSPLRPRALESARRNFTLLGDDVALDQLRQYF